MKRLSSLVLTLFFVSLILGLFETQLPGHFDQDELFLGQSYYKLDFFATQWRYVKVLLWLDWGVSPLFAYTSARAVIIPYLISSMKMMIVTLGICFSILFLLLMLPNQSAKSRLWCGWLSDLVLSIPMLFILPLFFWIFRESLMDWTDFYKMLLVCLIVAIKPAFLLWQNLDQHLFEIKQEPFVQTWFAIGGGNRHLNWRWLRKFWLNNLLQWFPYLLSQFLMGSFLATNLLQIPSYGYLFAESLAARDWNLFGPLAFLIAVIMLSTQFLVDIFSHEIKR